MCQDIIKIYTISLQALLYGSKTCLYQACKKCYLCTSFKKRVNLKPIKINVHILIVHFIYLFFVSCRTSQATLEGSVQRKLTWVENTPTCWLLALRWWRWALFGFLICCHLVLNIFCFCSVLNNFYASSVKNKRSGAIRFLCFTYSFVSLIMHQYYWCCDSHSAYGQSGVKKKKSANFSYCPDEFLPYKRRVPSSTNYIHCKFYLVPILLALYRSYRFTCFSKTHLLIMTYCLGMEM